MDEKNIKSFEKDLVHLDAQFTLDQLDDWLTTAGLIESALSMINHRIPNAQAHLFLHSPESHEYREIIQEGLFTIPEDSLFIACLSMQDRGSSSIRFLQIIASKSPCSKRFLSQCINPPMLSPSCIVFLC